VLQGLTLPAVIRWSGVQDDGSEEAEDLLARRRATEAALGRLDELRGEEWTRDETIERMRGLYEYRTRRLGARAGETDDGDGYEHRSLKYQKMVREVIRAQRQAVVALRNDGTISNDVMHRIERELDLEEERLEL
jgi:CPA1 family monovalent cation:H+ antiporter